VPRRAHVAAAPDFLFPQAGIHLGHRTDTGEPSKGGGNDDSARHWHPDFVDYLYVSYTNATAFSPTDTMPLSHRAKLLMLVQSAAALVIVALIAGRAVNILH
jgi:hypothetical protein